MFFFGKIDGFLIRELFYSKIICFWGEWNRLFFLNFFIENWESEFDLDENWKKNLNLYEKLNFVPK